MITGATRGIGNAIAQQLAADGFAVAACGTMSEERAAERLKTVKDKTDLLYIRADMSRQEDRERLISSVVDHFGRIDALINNAGVGSAKQENILDVSEESLDRVMDINLKGYLFTAQLAAKQMIRQRQEEPEGIRPVIINMSSISAYTLSLMRGEYCMSKAAITMLTRLLALPWQTMRLMFMKYAPATS